VNGGAADEGIGVRSRPARLRIASFNLESLDDRPGLDPPLEARIAVLRPQLLRLRADILCLQEVHGQRPPGGGPRQLLALRRLLEGTQYARFHLVSTRSPGAHGQEGWVADVHNLVVLSRHPVVASRAIAHERVEPLRYRPVTASPAARGAREMRFDRPALYVEVALPGGRRLHLVDVHFRAPLAVPVAGGKTGPFSWRRTDAWAEGFFMAGVLRAAQALEVRLLVDGLLDREPEALLAVVGDMNAGLEEVPLRILLAEPGDTGNGLLAHRALVPLGRHLPADRRFTVVHHGRRLMFDHLLVSRSLLAGLGDFDVHNEMLEDEVEAQLAVAHATESYHAPLVATFEL
jgi:endonuclease/exonuclease/phosphatase family metal-dependent hydrolase